MKLVKITAVRSNPYPYKDDGEKTVKELLLELSPERIPNREIILVLDKDYEKTNRARLVVETYETHLVNIDYIVSFRPTTTTLMEDNGDHFGSMMWFTLDKECFKKLLELRVLGASQSIGTIRMMGVNGEPWVENVNNIEWPKGEGYKPLYEDSIHLIQYERNQEKERLEEIGRNLLDEKS